MRFFKYIKKYRVELITLSLIAIFGYLYFVIYMTPSRLAWYNEMYRQIKILIFEIINIGR